MQAHLSKPLRLRELQSALNIWSKRRASAESHQTMRENEGEELNPELVKMYEERKERALELASQLVSQHDLDATLLAELASELHQIAGVAAFFGQADLGEKSRRLEKQLLGEGDNKIGLVSIAQDLLAA